MPYAKLYLIEAAPMTASVKTNLSYFSSVKLAKGTLVRIPLRKSRVAAVVLNSKSIKSERSRIRKANFPLKKIAGRDIFSAALPEAFLDAAAVTAEFYAASVGSALSLLVPKEFLKLKTGTIKKNKKGPAEVSLFQMEYGERFVQYRARVRQSFARSQSVLLIVPTHYDAELVYKELSRGIEEFVYTEKDWGKALSDPHPVLFITTPSGVSFYRPDLAAIIVERENSRAYRAKRRPYLNFKNFIEIYAGLLGLELVLGDSVLSLQTLWREKNGAYGENSQIAKRLSGVKTVLADGKSPPDERGRFEIFSRELKELLQKAGAEKERIFLFGARKGLAPTTICGDCGSVLECPNCKAPLVLHQKKAERIYVCHACGRRESSNTTCGYCKSWRLVPLGIGTDEIARQVQAVAPDKRVAIIDSEHKKVPKDWDILVGTEQAFFYLESIPYAGIVSLDALFSIPDFGINERIFYLVSHLRELTKTELVIQTRNIGKQILFLAATGNITDFYQNEIAERLALSYPPFSIFIKIEGAGLPKDKFARWQPDVLKDSLIIRMPREQWPDRELLGELLLLPPQFNIKVDPESIL